ncbi:MAG: ABC transporter permease [Proteobacteria bacterium]|nr:MAG: ABC transporter permease [Pseudomonadota bacterium]
MLSFESPVRTPWHRVPLSWKFLAVCISSLGLFLCDDLLVQLIALCVCVGLYFVGGKRFFSTGFKRIWFLWPMALIIFIWHAITDTTLQGISIVLRLVTIVALSNLMTMTSRLTDLIALAHRAMLPLRKLGISTRPIEMAIALVVRFTPILIEKGTKLTEAWRLRATSRPSWRLIFPLTIVAIDDAERVAEALKARGGARTKP